MIRVLCPLTHPLAPDLCGSRCHTNLALLTSRGLDQGFRRGRAWEEYKRWAAASARTRQDHVGMCLVHSRAARTHALLPRLARGHVSVRLCDDLPNYKNARTRTRLFSAHAVLPPSPPHLSHYTATISPVVCGHVYCVLRVLRTVQLFALAPLLRCNETLERFPASRVPPPNAPPSPPPNSVLLPFRYTLQPPR